MASEITDRADFSQIRYAQCWEDADILVKGLAVGPNSHCLTIASAGDNALSLLAQGAKRVVALDLNPAQLACLALRVAAYHNLSHPQLLELMGSRPSTQRKALYARCRVSLSLENQRFWDTKGEQIAAGIGSAGKFERYFRLFRQRALTLVHPPAIIQTLLQGGSLTTRRDFYQQHWNTWRWRWLFRLFFSRFIMGRMGRDPEFFRYVKGNVAEHILCRTKHALTELDPSENPYLTWILTGHHGQALPHALREENFEPIRAHLDRLEWHVSSVEDYLREHAEERFQCFNLSDIFEYMSKPNYHALLKAIIQASQPSARLAYWNMLVPRRRPTILADRLHPLDTLAKNLFAQDKAFFYMDYVIEEVQ